MILPGWRFWGVISLHLMLLSGCATTSIFSPYPEQMRKIMYTFKAGETETALSRLDRYHKTADAGLYLLEQGRLAQVAGKFDDSLTAYQAAIAFQQKVDEEARISATRTAASGAALLTNDNALPYRLSAFERVLMYQMQALNYLALGKIDSALVEVRRAEQEQRLAREEHEAALEKAHEEADSKNIDLEQGMSELQARYQALMDQGDNGALSVYQNAYVHYVSGLIYELAGQTNDAYIDYKRAHEMLPANLYLLHDIVRLADQLGMREDFRIYSALLETPKESADAENAKIEKSDQNKSARQIVVLFEQGQISSKQETRLDVATPQGWFSVALPIYYDYELARPLAIKQGSKLLASTALMMDTDRLARKNLGDNMPIILTRQILRVMTKQSLRRKANDNFGPGMGFIGSVLSVITEQADRRSWLSLPSNGQMARFTVPEGAQTLTFTIQGSSLTEQFVLPDSASPLQVIRVVQLGDRLYIAPMFPPVSQHEVLGKL